LVLLLLFGPPLPTAGVVVRALACAMLIRPNWLYRPLLWALLASLLLLSVSVTWYVADNHQFLIAYWTCAVAIVIGKARPEEELADAAKDLLGLAFALAVVWKIIPGEYLNGSFWEATILIDSRLSQFASVVGGL